MDFEKIIEKLEQQQVNYPVFENCLEYPIEIIEKILTPEEFLFFKQRLEKIQSSPPNFTKDRESSKCKGYSLPHWNCTGDFAFFTIPCDHYSEVMRPSIVVLAGYLEYECTCSKRYYPPFITVRVRPD